MRGQDSLAVKAETAIYTQQDIAIDTARVQKKTFSPGFARKYSGEEFDYRPKPKQRSLWDKLIEAIAYLIARLFRMGGKTAVNVAAWLLYAVAVIVIAALVYFVAKALLNKEGQWIFGKSTSKRILTADEVERNIQAADFATLVAETIASGDRRLAVRYYYLWLLQKLSRSGIIEWDIEKTNSDYLYEIANEDRRKDFAYLSYLYNYIWYGEFETSEQDFDRAVSAFEKTIRTS